MADIFISYAREDIAKARVMAKRLKARGWSVFWDREILHGKDFDVYIQSELDAARCIVVLWSKASVGSHYVRAEAQEGHKNERLVPARIEPVTPSLAFRQLQTADLTDWTGQSSHEEFDHFLTSIAAVLATQCQSEQEDSSTKEEENPNRIKWAGRLINLIVFVTAGLACFATVVNSRWIAALNRFGPTVVELDDQRLRTEVDFDIHTQDKWITGRFYNLNQHQRLRGAICVSVSFDDSRVEKIYRKKCEVSLPAGEGTACLIAEDENFRFYPRAVSHSLSRPDRFGNCP